ncbi:glycosyltransferase family 2 protein [Haladaptatus caseinilyticus]|uniref:glycosyltransferase family 2 protein n=1 Tax=Haladaptatus caseinilyticus TaxID=2993314 RepID=UPI00224B3A26|nr:glycosyltransferase family 2 protein [Haladaptatus caseinilyticus]
MASEEHRKDSLVRSSEAVVTRSDTTTSSLDDHETPSLSVVLPTRNEEEGISECLDRIHHVMDATDMEIEIIVSDSSTDHTPDIAQEYGAIVISPPSMGYGNAYKYAFERVHGDFVVIGDADMSYDFEELPKLLTPLMEDEADLVLGSRFKGRIEPGAMPALHQYVGNPFLTAMLNRLFDANVTDAHSGFRAVRRDVLVQLELESDGMEFASEMIMKAVSDGFRIREVPITYHKRVGEATLESFSDGWRHLKYMILNSSRVPR